MTKWKLAPVCFWLILLQNVALVDTIMIGPFPIVYPMPIFNPGPPPIVYPHHQPILFPHPPPVPFFFDNQELVPNPGSNALPDRAVIMMPNPPPIPVHVVAPVPRPAPGAAPINVPVAIPLPRPGPIALPRPAPIIIPVPVPGPPLPPIFKKMRKDISYVVTLTTGTSLASFVLSTVLLSLIFAFVSCIGGIYVRWQGCSCLIWSLKRIVEGTRDICGCPKEGKKVIVVKRPQPSAKNINGQKIYGQNLEKIGYSTTGYNKIINQQLLKQQAEQKMAAERRADNSVFISVDLPGAELPTAEKSLDNGTQLLPYVMPNTGKNSPNIYEDYPEVVVHENRSRDRLFGKEVQIPSPNYGRREAEENKKTSDTKNSIGGKLREDKKKEEQLLVNKITRRADDEKPRERDTEKDKKSREEFIEKTIEQKKEEKTPAKDISPIFESTQKETTTETTETMSLPSVKPSIEEMSQATTTEEPKKEEKEKQKEIPSTSSPETTEESKKEEKKEEKENEKEKEPEKTADTSLPSVKPSVEDVSLTTTESVKKVEQTTEQKKKEEKPKEEPAKTLLPPPPKVPSTTNPVAPPKVQKQMEAEPPLRRYVPPPLEKIKEQQSRMTKPPPPPFRFASAHREFLDSRTPSYSSRSEISPKSTVTRPPSTALPSYFQSVLPIGNHPMDKFAPKAVRYAPPPAPKVVTPKPAETGKQPKPQVSQISGVPPKTLVSQMSSISTGSQKKDPAPLYGKPPEPRPPSLPFVAPSASPSKEKIGKTTSNEKMSAEKPRPPSLPYVAPTTQTGKSDK